MDGSVGLFFSVPLSEHSLKPHLSCFRLRVTMFAASDRVREMMPEASARDISGFTFVSSKVVSIYLISSQEGGGVIGGEAAPRGSKPNLRCARCIMTVITSAQIRRFMRRITERFAQKRLPLRGNQLSFILFFCFSFLAQFSGWKLAPTCGRMCSQKSQWKRLS